MTSFLVSFLIKLGIHFSLYFGIILYNWLKAGKYSDLSSIFIIKACSFRVLIPWYMWHLQWVTWSFYFLLMLINCKTFSLSLFLKILFYKSKCYFLYILCLFVTWSKLFYSYTIVIRSSCLFSARVGIYNFNLRSFKQKPNRCIKKGLFTIRINKPFKYHSSS